MTSTQSSKGLLALPLAGLICFVGAWTLSATSPAPATMQATGEEHVEEEHTVLQLSMKTMYRSTKALRPMLRDFDANQKAIIDVIGSMEGALITSLSQTPPRPEKEMTTGEWAQYEINFHKKIHASLGLILDMKLAAEKGDTDGVIEASRNLNRGKKDGHGTYKLD